MAGSLEDSRDWDLEPSLPGLRSRTSCDQETIIQVMETEGRGRESERYGRVAVGFEGGAIDSVMSSLRITTSTTSRCRSPSHAQRSLVPLHSFSFSLLFIRLFLLSFLG